MEKGNLHIYGVIYKITNTINGKVYIGQTTRKFNDRYSAKGTGMERVYNYHKKYSRYNNKYNDHLLFSIEKYSISSFVLDKEIDYAFSKEELNIKEKTWIRYYNSDKWEFGYNKNNGGNNAKPNKNTIEKLKKSLTGREFSKEHILHLKEYQRNRPKSHNYNISKSKKGKPSTFKGKHLPNSAKLILSKYAKERTGEKNSFYGKHHTRETLNKISGANNYNAKKVVCLTTKEEFGSIIQASKKYNVDTSLIGRACIGKSKYAGVYNNKPLVWMFYKEYKQISENDIKNKLYECENINYKGRKVICISNNKIYNSAKDAAIEVGTDARNIRKACNGKLKTAKSLIWEWY